MMNERKVIVKVENSWYGDLITDKIYVTSPTGKSVSIWKMKLYDRHPNIAKVRELIKRLVTLPEGVYPWTLGGYMVEVTIPEMREILEMSQISNRR